MLSNKIYKKRQVICRWSPEKTRVSSSWQLVMTDSWNHPDMDMYLKEWLDRLTRSKTEIHLMSAGLIMWPRPFTSPMTLVLDFQGQILTLWYLGIRKGDSTYITKAVWVDRKLDLLHVCDHNVWPWTWISRSNFENAVCCYTHSDLDRWPLMTLNSDCQAQTFRKLYLSNGRVAWHRSKGL